MAIQPIDLQTLFTQSDKVGKTQAIQREGLQIQQALQHVESQRKAEEQIRSVNEAQNTGEGAEKIKDQKRRRGEDTEEEEGQPKEDKKETEKKDALFFTDHRLGRNVDISG